MLNECYYMKGCLFHFARTHNPVSYPTALQAATEKLLSKTEWDVYVGINTLAAAAGLPQVPALLQPLTKQHGGYKRYH